MTESPAKFSNLTKDNRKGENIEESLHPQAVLFSLQEKSLKLDVPPVNHEVYSRQPSYQKKFLEHQNIEESVNFLRNFFTSESAEQNCDILQFRFTIDAEMNALSPEVCLELSNIFLNKPIVLLFSRKDGREFLVYWKFASMKNFLSLKKFELLQDLNYTEFYEFIVDFLLMSIRNNHTGIRDFISNTNREINISDLADNQNCNLFQNAAENGELNVVEIITKHGKMDFATDMPNHPLSPQALALKNGHLVVLSKIIEANYTYSLFMDTTNFPDEIKKFIEIGIIMHEAIKSKNEKKILEILSINPKQKHYYNLFNQSALKAALRLKSFKIYKILLTNGVEFGPHEDDFSFLTPREKRKLTDIHFEHSKGLPDNHINILMMNTTVSHDDNNREDKEKFIKKAYDVLNQIPSTKVILEAVAASKSFEIVFDFKRDSVHMVDLETDKDTKGVFHSSGRICVGAKQLLDQSTEHETFGTLAHEMCHYALHLTYNNRAKPYKEGDIEKSKKFAKVNEICEKNKQIETLVNMVYENYEDHELHAELAVRAPHLIAQYYNQPERLVKSREEYPEMFDYYENIVVPDMTQALPKISKKADEVASDKIIKICFLISLFLISLSCYILYCMFYTPFYEYIKLSEDQQKTVRNSLVTYRNVDVHFWQLYPNDSRIYENLTSEHITKIFDNEKLDLNPNYFGYLTSSIYFSWMNLTKPLKDKFLNTSILFQNQSVSLTALNVLYSNAFNSLTSDQIISVLDGQTQLSIGKVKEMSSKFYIERKFIPENSIIAQIKYENAENKANFTFESFYESYPKDELRTALKNRIKSYTSHVGNSVDKISEYNAITQLINYTIFHKSFESIKNLTKNSKIFVLSSEAGAGKTVTFEFLAINLKDLYPTKWVSYIDLKDFTSLYDNLTNAEDLIEKILNLTSANEFEREIFKNSYKLNNSIFLWNGFDEVSPFFGDFVLNTVKNIKESTRNIQYICTRPQYSNQLADKLDIDPYMLVPFNKTEQIQFLKEFYKSKNIKNETERINQVLKVIEKVNNDSNRSFDSPLLLSMFAEVSSENPNLFKIYQDFIEKKEKILTDKKILKSQNSIIEQHSSYNRLKIYQRFSVKIDIFPFAFSTHPAIHSLAIFRNEDLDSFDYTEIAREGILYVNNVTRFEFAHKTFAEFFIAQYLVDNIYRESFSGLSSEEVDARLELFFFTIQYSYTFEKVIDFVRDYVNTNNRNRKFLDKIRYALKTKYKKHLIYILDKPYKDSFRFFFEFFKKDRELMLDMLKVNEPETFYTAFSNPFYMANNLSPEDVKATVKPYLTDSEFNNFINGQHQRGVILYGMFHRQEFDKLETENLSISNETLFWDFFDLIKPNFTKKELEQMFLNPVVTIMYRKHSSTNETNQKFWSEVEKIFNKSEMSSFIGNLLPQIFRPKLDIPNEVDVKSLNMLLVKIEELLTKDEIFEMAAKTHLIFKSARSYPHLQIIWDFVAKYTDVKERKYLLSYDFNKGYAAHDKQYYSMYYKFFVMTPMVLHVSIFSDDFSTAIDFVEKIYNETFDKSEILDFFNKSNDFLFPLIFTRPIEACQKIASYLERLYKGGDEGKLIELLEKDFNRTGLTVFEYFDKMLAFSFNDRKNIKKKLKVFLDLRNKLKKL